MISSFAVDLEFCVLGLLVSGLAKPILLASLVARQASLYLARVDLNETRSENSRRCTSGVKCF